MDVTLTSRYRNPDYFQGKNSPVYVYQTAGTTPPTDLSNYYTKTELLTDGVLDARYYTETELTGGALDGRYYTETELTGGALDGRYYTETEIDNSVVKLTGNQDIYGIKAFRNATRFRGSLGAALIEFTDGSFAPQLKIFSSTPNNASAVGSLGIVNSSGTPGSQLYGKYSTGDSDWGRYIQATSAGVTTLPGSLVLDDIDSKSVSFSSGYTGTGFSLDYASSKYSLEVDNLLVRGNMRVYSLEVNKIRATNGSLWVSDAVEAVSDMTLVGSWYTFSVESGFNTFAVNDIVRVQQYNGGSVFAYDYKVQAVTSTTVGVSTVAGGAVPVGERTCKGRTFVRIGNSSNTARQGAVYLTASDTNAPYIEVLDGVTSGTIDLADRKVRLGKLDGLSFNGSSISGYGLYAGVAYLEGSVVATAGSVGGWDISGDLLQAETASGGMYFDAADPSIILKDDAGIVRYTCDPSTIETRSTLLSLGATSYSGSYAATYTDVVKTLYDVGTSDDYYYCQKYTTTTYLDWYTSKQSSTYSFTVTPNLPYIVDFYVNCSLGYTLPTNDYDETDGETHVYTLYGTWSATYTVYVYDANDNLLDSASNSTGSQTGNLSAFPVGSGYLSFIPTTSTIYLRLRVQISNSLQTNDHYTYYVWDGFEWVYDYEGDIQQSLTVNFTTEQFALTIKQGYDQVHIGKDGFLHWKNDHKYFIVNASDTNYIQAAGDFYHYYGSFKQTDGVIGVGTWNMSSGSTGRLESYSARDGAVGLPAYYYDALVVVSNHASSHAAFFQNDGNNINRYGIGIQCGVDTPSTADNFAVRLYDGDGTYKGGLFFDSGQVALYNASDERMKVNIKDYQEDALEILSGFKPRLYQWRKKTEIDVRNPDGSQGKRKTRILDEIPERSRKDPGAESVINLGYVAQEMEAYLPDLVVTDDETGYKFTAPQGMIPVLHRAILQLQDEIKELKTLIN